MTTPHDRIVLCMKWGPVFPADYVNVLYTATCKAMSGPFRFVCLTDETNGLLDGIEAFPIPDIGLHPDQYYLAGVWRKLSLYVADLHGLSGRCLFIDLDMMVLRDLDAFFDAPDPFITTDMGQGWRAKPRPGPREAGTCIFAFNIGQEAQILDTFRADPAQAMERFKLEQDYVGAHASSISFWPEGWVISFKRHLRQPIGKDLFFAPSPPPDSAKILAFHGTPRPADLIKPGHRFWDRLPHMGNGKVPWVTDYWTDNGGSLGAFDQSMG